LGEPLIGPVSSENIEAALATDWRQLHSTIDGREGALARASVLTLIVTVAEPANVDRALDALGHLSRQHPSRTIVLLPTPADATPDLQVWHDTSCLNTAERDQLLCGEQIVVAARGGAVHHLYSLADQLTIPDLPTFLWWVGDLPARDDMLFEPLTELVDRLIVDSANFRALGPSLAWIDQVARRRHAPCAPSDLTWTRLTPWRDLVAQFFDAPTLRPYLDSLDRVTLASRPGSPAGAAQVLLLIAWLAGRLGWQVDQTSALPLSGSIDRWTTARLRDRRGQPVEVTVQPDRAAEGPDGLRQLTLSAGADATFVVGRDPDGTHAHTEADLAGVPALKRAARFETSDLSALLADELMLLRRDHVYEEAVAVAARLATQRGG
jgi:glucose-6-phosphate dehydrogenase assembly protein OpcA